MTPDHISHSALDQYIRCSWQYKLERVDKLSTPPAWFFMGGSAVHEATALMDIKDEYPYTDDQLEYMWSEAFNKQIAEAYKVWPNDKQWRQAGRYTRQWPDGQRYKYWNERGIAAVKAWHDWRMKTKDELQVVAVELPVEFKTPSGVTVRGIIDRVMTLTSSPGVVFPLDIKTGTKRPASRMQLALYREGLRQQFDVPVADIGAWWMAKDAESFEVGLSHLDIHAIDKFTQAYFRGVENEVFIPQIGDSCFNCPFTRQCFAHPDGAS